MNEIKFSFVILSYNRPDRIQYHFDYIKKIQSCKIEIIFVDNASDIHVDSIVDVDKYRVVRNSENLGAVGRNSGMKIAQGDYIITLDDDVYGISDKDLINIDKIMCESPKIGAINFKIVEEGSGKTTDWCHPCLAEEYVDKYFETYDISEGAVVFRKKALQEVGYYPDSFFISHEGPDLAFRLINYGWDVIYSPDVVVIHGYDQSSRESWRRYYYDTRNQLWFVLRNMNIAYGLRQMIVGWGSTLIYSLRDGYFKFWIKAVLDSLIGAPREWKSRVPPNKNAIQKWKFIEKNKKPFLVMLQKRLFKSEIRAN